MEPTGKFFFRGTGTTRLMEERELLLEYLEESIARLEAHGDEKDRPFVEGAKVLISCARGKNLHQVKREG